MAHQRTVLGIAMLVATTLSAQEHVHLPGMTHNSSEAGTSAMRQPGQAAFGAIAEVVATLLADSTTDWSRVDIEALRQHLLDMDDVTMRSEVKAEGIPGGARFIVTGQGRTVDAIRRMTRAHSQVLGPPYRMVYEERPGGAALTVTADAGGDVSRIRGLGFIGLLTVGSHHLAHHLAIARGETPEGHVHK